MITKLIRAISCALLLSIGLLCHLSSTARAETLVYTDTIPLTRTDWNDTLTIPRFDPTVGILTGVEITLTADITGAVGVENRAANPIAVLVQEQATVNLTLPMGGALAAGGTVISQNVNLGVSDGIIDFAGPGGITLPVLAAVANSQAMANQADLAFFSGAGTIPFPTDARVQWTGSGSGNMILEFNHFVNANLTVRYTYAVPQIVIKKFTNGFDADNPNDSDVPRLNPGDPIIWTYLVTNTGPISIPLALVNVSDSQPGVTPQLVPSSDSNVIGQLEPGETWTYRATGAVAENLAAPAAAVTIVPGCNPGGAAAPGNRPTYRNIGTVVVPGDSATDPSHYCNPPAPGLVIQKLTNGADANNPNGNDVPQVPPGAVVAWTYLVTNTGNITYTVAQVVVTDNQPGVTPVFDPASDVNGDGLLSPGERWRYTATGTAANLQTPPLTLTVVAGCNPNNTTAPGPRNTYANIGTVSAPGASASDPSHYCNPPAPGIVIRKLTNGFDANNPNDSDVPQLAPGAAVTWTYLVTNTGNITFARASVLVVDSQTGVTPLLNTSSDVKSDNLLAPGESWRYTATGTAANLDAPATPVTRVPGCNPGGAAAPGNRPTYRNIGTVTVPGATATDPSHYCNPAQPGITIQKYTNGADADDPNGNDVPRLLPGQPVTWTYVITNTGNVTFTVAQVVVTDSHASVIPVRVVTSDRQSDGLLVPGESWLYRAVGVALDVKEQVGGVTFTEGCQLTIPPFNSAYANIGGVRVPGAQASDPSHYCNPIPTGLLPDGSEPTVRFFLALIRR